MLSGTWRDESAEVDVVEVHTMKKDNSTAVEKRESNTVNIPERIDEGVYYTPLVDIVENDDGFVFQADLPGVKREDLDISYDNGTLTILGKVNSRQKPDQQYVWREFGVGHFYRSFSLNTEVDVDSITAELNNGVLTLRVPKATGARTRKIQIKT